MVLVTKQSCSLCLSSKGLVGSHIMPQSMYRAAGRSGEPYENDLVLVDATKGTAVRTSQQLKQRLLCADCEGLLNQRGENYFARICYQGNGKFILRSSLAKILPDQVLNGRKVWHGQSLRNELDINAIKHFFMRILWLHSICTVSGFASGYSGALGAKYEEQFRKYLFGNSAFPSKVQIYVYVDDDAENTASISHPTCQRTDDLGISVRTHSFVVPGCRVRVIVGGPVDNIRREGDSDVVFFQWNSAGTDFMKDVARNVSQATAKGKFANEVENRLRNLGD